MRLGPLSVEHQRYRAHRYMLGGCNRHIVWVRLGDVRLQVGWGWVGVRPDGR